MRTDIVFMLAGPDRVGIVEEVTRVLLELGGNVETSRMARLGGAFAILMQVGMPPERIADVDLAFRHLTDQGYQVTTSRIDRGAPSPPAALPYRIDVQGADHEGIVHEIAAGLSVRGINIESMETATSQAPVSATPLFSMNAVVAVPSSMADEAWETDLAEAARQSGVDITVTALEEE